MDLDFLLLIVIEKKPIVAEAEMALAKAETEITLHGLGNDLVS